MKLCFKFITAILVIILSTLLVQKQVQAVETYIPGPILFQDDFNDGNYNGWIEQTSTGGWRVRDGFLEAIKVGQLISGRLTSFAPYDNYVLEMDVRGFNGIDQGVGFRKADSLNGYELNLRYQADYRGSYNTPQFILRKGQNGVITDIAQTTQIPLDYYKWYHLKIEVVQDHIQIWLDSTLVFDLNDQGTTVKKGGLSLVYSNGQIGVSQFHFDNIKVSALSKKIEPVIFIPGIGGSEFKASSDINWSADNGHGGIYSNTYSAGEKIWVNQDEAIKLGHDDYFDVLRLNADGITPQAPELSLTGTLTPFGYSDIDSFFTGMGYSKGTNYFVFAYDWRKDIRSTEGDLDLMVDQAIQKSGFSKVNIVAHSMGGLVARNYIIKSDKAAKVNKLIGLGVPHLGTVRMLKGIIYGDQVGPSYLFGLISLNTKEVSDVLRNITGSFQILPYKKYYDFYNNSDSLHPYPFYDARDIDNNGETGLLNLEQIRSLLKNLGFNMNAYKLSEEFRNIIESTLNQNLTTKIYSIVGSGSPTLGQIKETWLINWPIKLIPRYDEIYIGGDGVVPIYSASLRSNTLDLSDGARIYYIEENHIGLVNPSSTSMQTVKQILGDSTSLPVEIKSEKINLEGQHISVDQDATLDLFDDEGKHTGLNDNGEIEANIPETHFDTLETTKHAFIKKKANKKVTTKITSKSKEKAKTNVKLRHYKEDKVTKTAIYKDIPLSETSKVEVVLDPTTEISPAIQIDNQPVPPTAEVEGSAALDQTSPQTKVEIVNNTTSATVTITPSDSESGVLKTEYSLDNGQTVQLYTGPFTVTTPGTTKLQVKTIDKLGNEEIPQEFNITLSTPSPSPFPSSTTNTSNSSSNNSGNTSTTSITQPTSAPSPLAQVLGITFNKPLKDIILEGVKQPLGSQNSIASPRSLQNDSNEAIDQHNNSAQNTLRNIIILGSLVAAGMGAALGATFLLRPTPK